MHKKKIKLYLVFVFCLFVFVLYFTLKDNFTAIIDTLANVKLIYFLFGIIIVFISKLLMGVIVYCLSKKEYKKIDIKKIFKIELIYPFFAGITPGSIGGESSEIIYLKQSGVPYGKASSTIMQKYIIYQIALITINFIVVILNLFINIIPNNGLVTTLVILNFGFNCTLLGLLYLLTYNKRFNHFIMNKGLSFLYKIRIVKDLESTKNRVDSYLNKFEDGAEKLKSDKKMFFWLILICIMSLILLIGAIIPVSWALNISGISILNLFILGTYIKMISLLLVTPGNSGASEYAFIYLFTGLLANEDIMAYMLIWRVVTYYIPLTVGGILAMTWRGDDNE